MEKMISVNLKENSKLRKLIQNKINRIITKYPDIPTKPKVILKNDNDEKIIEISMKFKNHDIFVKKTTNTFEKSFNEAYKALKNKIDHLK